MNQSMMLPHKPNMPLKFKKLNEISVINVLDTENTYRQAAKKKEEITPLDFIKMLRDDPDMQDEFCYLNKRSNAYDFYIVDFNERAFSE